MRIKTKFQLNTLLYLGMILGIGTTLFLTSQKVSEAIQKSNAADQVAQGIFELNILTDDYLLKQRERVKLQWQIIHDSLPHLLTDKTFPSPEAQRLLEEIRQNHEKLKTIFDRLVASFETSKDDGETSLSKAAQESLISQLLTASQVMVSNAKLLSQSSKEEVITIQQRASIGVILLVIFVAIAVMVNSFFLRKGIIEPIATLQKGSQIIGGGNLDYQVGIDTRDEIGELSRAFDQMTANLKSQRGELHQLNEELEKHRDHLERLVEERTAELKDTNKQLLQEAEARKQYAAALESSNKELDDFAYITSHDLKEPLRAIQAYGQALVADYGGKFDEEGNWKLARLIPLTQRMANLLDTLLYYSRVGRTELAFQEVNLGDILKDILERLDHSIQEKEFEIRIPQPLPTVYCDSARVGEIFHNFISNAIKYNDKPDKWIEIGWKQGHSSEENSKNAKDSYIYYVRDNGIGIREKHFDSIFRIFKRLHGKDKFGGGIGAGLTLTKKIIERHKGRVWVESTYGEGTTFYFTLQKGA